MVQIGDRVSIVDGKEYKGRYIGLSGEVVRISYPTLPKSDRRPKVGVQIDGHINQASGYGCYWFDDNSLEAEEEYNMTDYKRAKIRFLGNPYVKSDKPNGTTWVYSTTMDDLQPGDTLVVHTSSHGLAVAEFVEYTEEKLTKVNREIMARVDLTEYNERKERAKKILSLKREMDKALKEAQDLALYEALAKNNPALAAMLEEYKELTQTDRK